MKNLKELTRILFLSLLLVSCGNESKKVGKEIENSTQSISNAKNVVNDASEMEENIRQLRKKEYLTKEQWESWLPKVLLDMPITYQQLNFMPGLGSCGATYKIGNKSIRVMVIDGAGEKGASGVGPYRMSSKMDYDSKDEWGSTKTVVIDGIKAKKSYVKTSGMYSLSMFYNHRFAIDIEAHNFSEDKLAEIVKELNLSELKKF
ncbi:hypothetical protein ATE92_2658 [Ulvibacter sp. MAR_2010_11]|uniref:hypothetical protein n=1 Tax=Ulvibacter sp. MAR_2010_11 TaxID=1250229 RepID=UPI000C2CC969|nr:hypothetical protein [Ulvibacter sp. MAR_2010_11]PKA84468.1 hypothetical protein ATE92_2658 [Ulvibacter sp. MAR_2010_11]